MFEISEFRGVVTRNRQHKQKLPAIYIGTATNGELNEVGGQPNGFCERLNYTGSLGYRWSLHYYEKSHMKVKGTSG